MVTEMELEVATPSSLHGEELERVVVLINQVYRVAERGMWIDETFKRTDIEEVSGIVRDGELMVCRSGGRVVGCVQCRMLNPSAASFGMLVCDEKFRGRGIGKALIARAEERAREKGAKTLQLELLHPIEWKQETKAVLEKWYPKLGFNKTEEWSFDELYPHLAKGLAHKCFFTVFLKELR
ncbi:N-acetyltransferase domain-containing protein [Chloropicon primus]|uniref:N-acetyltransferase domain-containing protein n=1 Tax=Chloropicon primus TaxID=1764295 RepID=A0A5B8MT59_9CHLO|nr:hypothetical protein A3770_09p54920 [Chloropicon primus]UPR02191.1 N-acetyltransferase domain-containing protein [Chloropicon primus]|mmetsp:Transcript_9999/g.20252  ORF Transcript_9999/g.20252 Transcript_9999/m.20252 type:complete len:181 (+) Transcript_9999:256-798(+)|eukprot:QDZ22974.1 hypothetical protein A3770_09p54920 [Chloropicon primus]